MTSTLETYTQEFFKVHEKNLKKNYPGLTVRRIKQELELLFLGILSTQEFFNSLYLPTASNPATRFFNSLELGIPLEYITGKAFFYRSEFSVTPDVLIPRSETEQLVEMGIAELNKWSKKTDETLKMIDVGTGSGVIPISILQDVQNPVRAMASDISKDALVIAKRNYFNLRYTIPSQSKLEFIETDRLNGVEENFHLIISNPPYIKREQDFELVHIQVKDFEPGLALWLNDNEYENWFEKFFKQVYDSLLDDGVFLMEGHENHLEDLGQLARVMGFSDVELKTDLTGRTRFVQMRKKNG